MRNLKPTRLGKTSRKKTLRSLAQAGLFFYAGGDFVEYTLIYKAASVWNDVSEYKYSFTYGFKKKLYTINLSFAPEDFPHLAGFQYLRDVHLPRFSSKKTVSKILDGTISQEMIEKGGQYEESVKPRLLALVSLEAMLDNNFTFYSFMPRFYSFFTSIKADYLIASHLENINYVFIIREGERSVVADCTCCSTFIKGYRDYEENQRPYTLLKKCKTHIATDNTEVLYIKEGFIEDDTSEESQVATEDTTKARAALSSMRQRASHEGFKSAEEIESLIDEARSEV